MIIKEEAKHGESRFTKSQIFRWSKKGSVAILDQVLFNGVHFLTSILLARWLEPAQYGIFAIAYSVFLLIGAFQMALLTEPMLVFGVGKYGDRFKEYLGTLILGNFAITIFVGFILMGTSLFIRGIYASEIQTTLLALSIAAPFGLLLWLLRRAFYVYMQPVWSALGGIIYFVLLLSAVFLLKRGHWLSPSTFFLSMGLCSGFISLFFVFLLRPEWPLNINLNTIAIKKDHLRYGRWALGTNILTWGMNNAYFVILPALIGLEGVATLRALMNLCIPIIQTNSALTFLFLPILSRQRIENIEKMKRTVVFFLSLFIAGAIIYLLGLIFFGAALIKLLYGSKYLKLSGLIPLVALLPLGTAITAVLENALRANEKTDKVFWSYMVSTVVALVGGIVLATIFSVKGVLWGYLLSYLVACVMMFIFYMNFINFQNIKTTLSANIGQGKLTKDVDDSRGCPVCGSMSMPMHRKIANFWRCTSCGLLFRHISNSQHEIFNLYKKSWLHPDISKDMTGGTDLRLARVYAQRLASSLGLKNFKGLKISDFGAGRGDMLMALSELGADVYGIEPFGCDYLKNKGFKVFKSLDEIPNGFLFDGIICTDVIEHLVSPVDTMRELFKFLNESGWFYMSTPNPSSLNARFFKSHWREFRNPSHVCFLTSVSSEVLFSKLGVLHYKRLRWFVQYGSNIFQKFTHFFLQFFQLDGVLRYVVWRSAK